VAAAVALVALVALVAPTGALAAGPPPKPKELSAISQYRESIPTPTGPTYLGSGINERVAPLPAKVEQGVTAQGGNDAPVLKAISTKSAYGAPQKRLPVASAKRTHVVPDRAESVPTAIFSATGELQVNAQGGRLMGLIGVLGLTTLAAAAIPLLRRRRADDGDA
jgi:hypothetical protein